MPKLPKCLFGFKSENNKFFSLIYGHFSTNLDKLDHFNWANLISTEDLSNVRNP